MNRIVPTLAIAAISAVALAGASFAQGVTPMSPNTTQSQTSPDTKRPDGSTTQQRSDSPNMNRQGAAGTAAQAYGWKSVDARTLGGGHRSSKFVGSNVVNEANETIGTVDDLIVMSNDKAPYAVISVGGFLGMGSRYVVVPYNALQMRDDKVILRGATKDSLKGLDEYKYPS